MPKTELLPTVTAVRMVWAMTGRFSDDEPSRKLSLYVEDTLRDIEQQVHSQGVSSEERSYVAGAIATMKASLRSLDTAYNGRELNFKENEKLRTTYLESVKDSLHFGTRAQDFLKSLPTMTIGAAGGVTVAKAIGRSEVTLWGVGLGLAGAGYLVNLLIVRLARRQTRMLYVIQDYERGMYYDQYVHRVADTLLGLFLDLERIHKRVFRENYESDVTPSALESVVNEILVGVHPTFCPYVHKHMSEGRITPELWATCESGTPEAVHLCPMWEGQRAVDPPARQEPDKV